MDGVMTTAEFGMESAQKKSGSKEKAKSTSKEKKTEITDIYELESANGKSGNCAFYDRAGDEVTLPLTDGCFTIPKDWNPVKRQQYRKMLLEAGFILQPTKVIETLKEVEIVTYSLLHPDHSENEPINGEFKVKVSGKQIKLNVVNGIIQTMDKKVKIQLKKKGFVENTGAMGEEEPGSEKSEKDNDDTDSDKEKSEK